MTAEMTALHHALILCNDGSPMSEGEIVNLLSVLRDAVEDGFPIPTGMFISPDARPKVGGHQVALDAEGRIDVTIGYEENPSRVRLIVFSDQGYAKVDAVLKVPKK